MNKELKELNPTNIGPPPAPAPQQYWDQGTIDLANKLLPKVLQGKTRPQIIEYLNDPKNYNLVNILKQFCNQTYRAQSYRNRMITYCCYQVLWESVGDIRNIDPRNMWNLNYLMFTDPTGAQSSDFIFAVLYCIKTNFKNILRQDMTAQGLSYCYYTGIAPN